MDERIRYLYVQILKCGREFRTHPKYGKGTYSNHKRVEVMYEYEHPHNGDIHWDTLFYLADPPETWARNFRDGGRYTSAPGGWFPLPIVLKFK